MSAENRRSDPGRIFWGLVLILIGALVLFLRYDFWDFGYLLSTWWPSILILIGISILIGNRFRRWGAGLILILIRGPVPGLGARLPRSATSGGKSGRPP